MKILVTGASGFLGRKAMEIFGKSYEVVGTAFSNVTSGLIRLDITNFKEVESFIYQQRPDVVFHTAAIVDIDLCEKDKAGAERVNVGGPLYLANLCHKEGIKFIAISSDYIFSGENSPYNEDAIPHPKCFYGLTKLKMEQAVTSANPDSLIVRLPILYGYNSPDTEDKLIIPTIRALKQGKEIIIEDYRKKYPVLIDDVINNTITLIKKNEKGIFHFTTTDPIDRFKIARIVAKVFKLDETFIKKGEAREFKNKPINVGLVNNRDKSLKFVEFEEGVGVVKAQMGLRVK